LAGCLASLDDGDDPEQIDEAASAITEVSCSTSSLKYGSALGGYVAEYSTHVFASAAQAKAFECPTPPADVASSYEQLARAHAIDLCKQEALARIECERCPGSSEPRCDEYLKTNGCVVETRTRQVHESAPIWDGHRYTISCDYDVVAFAEGTSEVACGAPQACGSTSTSSSSTASSSSTGGHGASSASAGAGAAGASG
jgi:hypothetical protein